MAKPCNRQTAREVIAEVLGLQSDNTAENDSKLRDDDDFYLLGGDSLLAVQTVEQLEALGFKVDMNIFYQTGHIGQILDSFAPPEDTASTKVLPVNSKSIEIENGSLNIPIRVFEWKKTKTEPTQEEIQQLVVSIFAKKDLLYYAFGLSVTDLEFIVGNFFRQGCQNTVLLAYIPTNYKHEATSEEYKLVGAMICCPSKDMNYLTKQPEKVELLNRYLLSSYPIHNEAARVDQIFYVGMTGVLSDQSREAAGFVGYDEARWKRMIMEVLLQMERQIIERAKTKGFTMLDRVNTTEITMKMSLDLGYRIVGKNNLKTFGEKENIEIDPKYHTHQCYYMLKELNDQ